MICSDNNWKSFIDLLYISIYYTPVRWISIETRIDAIVVLKWLNQFWCPNTLNINASNSSIKKATIFSNKMSSIFARVYINFWYCVQEYLYTAFYTGGKLFSIARVNVLRAQIVTNENRINTVTFDYPSQWSRSVFLLENILRYTDIFLFFHFINTRHCVLLLSYIFRSYRYRTEKPKWNNLRCFAAYTAIGASVLGFFIFSDYY